jgi:hypothetical protein
MTAQEQTSLSETVMRGATPPAAQMRRVRNRLRGSLPALPQMN